jgi:hypothetical protein
MHAPLLPCRQFGFITMEVTYSVFRPNLYFRVRLVFACHLDLSAVFWLLRIVAIRAESVCAIHAPILWLSRFVRLFPAVPNPLKNVGFLSGSGFTLVPHYLQYLLRSGSSR